MVARVVSLDQVGGIERLNREVAVVQHLVEKSAPVVGLANELPAGPHLHEGFALTLWQFVDHVAADADNAAHGASAATALPRIPQVLPDFPLNLPSFRI